MNPETARDKMPDYVTGRLDEAESRELRAHLRSDESACEYFELVSWLYRLDLEPRLAPPASLRAFEDSPDEPAAPARVRRDPRDPRRWRRIVPAAAALLLIAAGSLTLWRPDRPGAKHPGAPGPATKDVAANDPRRQNAVPPDAGPPDAGPPEAGTVANFTPLPLLPITVEHPSLPDGFHEGEWLESRSQAVLVSIYSGRPLLESYINPDCPVSRRVQSTMCSTGCRRELGDFVCYEEEFRGKVPAPVCGQVDANEILYRLPAVRVSGGSCDPQMVWGVSDWREVETELNAFRDRCKADGGQPPSPIDRDVFEHNLTAVRNALELVDSFRYAEALGELDGIGSSDAGRKTAFGPVSSRVARQLRDGIERELHRIETLAAGTPAERAQAADLARRFLARVEGLPEAEARLHAILD